MTGTKGPADRRAQHVALFGGVLQAVFCTLMFVLSAKWAGDSLLLASLGRWLSFGVPIWFILYLVLNQIRRVGAETLETEELRRAQVAGANPALFELDEEGLLLEQHRLKWMAQWLLPAGSVLVGILLLAGNFLFWGWELGDVLTDGALQPTSNATLMMWFVIGVGFLCFLYARYALAVSRLPQWGLIHAGAVCMAGCALACLLAGVALMAGNTVGWIEPVVVYVLRVALLVLGVEFIGNLILDIYRPRVPGEVPRPAFDSRVLGMICEPGGFASSIADAVNYQFGFHVSSTWFYKLLQRWMFPIVVGTFAVVLMLTSVVIVGADEQVVIERFGKRPTEVHSSGILFKLPYPIDIVKRAPVGRVSELVIGEADEDEHAHGHEAIIWTEPHEFIAEFMLLVAAPKSDEEVAERLVLDAATGEADATESVAVSLLMVSVPIQYRVKNTEHYLYKYADAPKLLDVVAHRYLSDYAASVDMDVIMAPGRSAFNVTMAKELQARLDELDVGIEIVSANIRGAHPPSEGNVAAAFQGVIAAQISKSSTIGAAKGRSLKKLIRLAGTEDRARKLDAAIVRRDELPKDSAEHAAAVAEVEKLIMGDALNGIAPISGEAWAMMADAHAAASSHTSRAQAMAQSFGTQVAAYEASPELYIHRKKLEQYESLADVRKYLLVGDATNVKIEFSLAKTAGLDEVLTTGLEKERKKAGQ